MPRRPRLAAAGVPMHITQRGHNRGLTFLDAADFAAFLGCLRDASRRKQCAVHAYALMSNHVHLLVTPGLPNAASHLMQSIGRRYVRYFNDRHRCRGTLWDGRFRSSIVDTAAYLLACCRYIDLNPVRAGIVSTPDAYEWTSYARLGLGSTNDLLTPHPEYLALGPTAELRTAAYRSFCQGLNGNRASRSIRHATHRGEALGRPAFRDMLERTLKRPVQLASDAGVRRRPLDGIIGIAPPTS